MSYNTMFGMLEYFYTDTYTYFIIIWYYNNTLLDCEITTVKKCVHYTIKMKTDNGYFSKGIFI